MRDSPSFFRVDDVGDLCRVDPDPSLDSPRLLRSPYERSARQVPITNESMDEMIKESLIIISLH
jgi:hypothetical protein